MITAVHLVNICHLTQSRFSFLMKTFKIFSLSDFQTYNTVLITVVQHLLNEQMSEYFLLKNSNNFWLVDDTFSRKGGGNPQGTACSSVRNGSPSHGGCQPAGREMPRWPDAQLGVRDTDCKVGKKAGPRGVQGPGRSNSDSSPTRDNIREKWGNILTEPFRCCLQRPRIERGSTEGDGR